MNGNNQLLILVSGMSPRVHYIFDFIFLNQLGIAWEVTLSEADFKNYEGAKINYTSYRIGDHLFIKEYGLLTQKGVIDQQINLTEKNGLKIFFQEDCDTEFDIFSASFYLLSRYEEYLPHKADDFGRFKATQSLAYKNNFLKKPLVDIWICELKYLLKFRFPFLTLKENRFNAIMTYDIDIAYKYKGRGIFRTLGGILKYGLQKDSSLKQRIATIQNKMKDPWDVYENLKVLSEKYQLPSIYFFLIGNKSRYDHNLSYNNKEMKSIVKQIQLFSEVGIHPSFKTSLQGGLTAKEIKRMEYLTNSKVTKSRQHYLKFSLPNTYTELFNLGIQEDYSMAYAESTGFRAGTSFPFYFYDLKNEKTVLINIFPAVCMEVTYRDFFKISAEDFLQECKCLADEVRKVNGTFISIWHNNTLGEDDKGQSWAVAHEKLMKYLYDLKNTEQP